MKQKVKYSVVITQQCGFLKTVNLVLGLWVLHELGYVAGVGTQAGATALCSGWVSLQTLVLTGGLKSRAWKHLVTLGDLHCVFSPPIPTGSSVEIFFMSKFISVSWVPAAGLLFSFPALGLSALTSREAWECCVTVLGMRRGGHVTGTVSLMLLKSHEITVRLTEVISSHSEQPSYNHLCLLECGHVGELVDGGGCGLEFSVLKGRVLRILISLEKNTS